MIALLIWCISAAPIDTSPSVEKFSIPRRDGVRPELGGVNFPGKLHYIAKNFKDTVADRSARSFDHRG